MAGPLGFGGDKRYVLPGQTLEYTVYFENKDTAEAAAQQITIDADLSEHLDWTTFQFGELVLANQSMEDFSGKKSGKATISLKGRSDSIKAELTFAQGHLKLYMRSYDATQAENDYWPADAYDGFLKPNDDTGRGEGHFTYSIAVKSAEALADTAGAVIAASADIKFDENAIIPTDPAWYNTVYSEAPVAVSETDVKADTPVAVATTYVSWTDGGGATSYDVTFWQLDAQGEAVASWTVTGLLTPTCTLPMALAGNTRYRWQITSRNPFGSSKSAAMEFTTEVTEIAAEITAVSASARWPWNGLVDITYTIEGGGDKLNATVGLKGYDADRDQTVDITSVTGPGADAPVTAAGTYTITWDASADNAGNSSAFEITLTATTAAAQEDTAKLTATSAEFRLETRESFGGLLATGVEYLSPTAGGVIGTLTLDGKAVAGWSADAPGWDSTAVADGLHTVVLTESGTTTTATLSVLNSTAVVHGGTLKGDETWGADRVHVIRNWVRIPAGKTLTIASGAIVKFCEDTGFLTEGTLKGEGAVFTSVDDDSVGGDTGLNGAAQTVSEDSYDFWGDGAVSLDGAALWRCTELPWSARGIAVNCEDAIQQGAAATLACEVDCGEIGEVFVTPTWSIAVGGAYATLSSDGVLTNTNGTYTAQQVTVTASFGKGAQAKTASKTITMAGKAVVPTGLVIHGDNALGRGESAQYTCTATFNNGSTQAVTPIWSLSSTAHATLSGSRVTNANKTFAAQTVTLTASYTAGGVTKTAEKAIALEGREVVLERIDIGGDDAIGNGEYCDYTCTATFNDGTTADVTPTWSLSSTAYASLASGRVTNRNGTYEAQTATLSARYTADGVTATAEKAITLAGKPVVLTGIVINGSGSIANGGTAAYTCAALFSDGTRQEGVNATWHLSATAYAALNGDTVTNINGTYKSQTATLTATYNGATATKTLTLLGKDIVLERIEITGNDAIANGDIGSYSCAAFYSDGSKSTVTPSWSVSDGDAAIVTATGLVKNNNSAFVDKAITLTAAYERMTATKAIALTGRPVVLESIAIGGDDRIEHGKNAGFTCTATYTDGSTKTVTPEWSLASTTYATLKDGVVTNANETFAEQTATLKASFTDGGVTKMEKKAIALEGKPILLESIAIGGDDRIGQGQSASYICTAKYTDGSTKTVTPAWSLLSTAHATLNGSTVANANETFERQSVALKASFTDNGITKTVEKTISLAAKPVVLESIAIGGLDALGNGKVCEYICTATYNDKHTANVTAEWSLSSTTYATLNGSTVTNGNRTFEEQSVVLTAKYTEGGITKTATKAIALAAMPVVLERIDIVDGASTIGKGATVEFGCQATYNDKHTAIVTAEWSLSSTEFARLEGNGVKNINETFEERTVTLMAAYTEGGVMKTASKALTLTGRPLVLADIAISGGSDTIKSGGSSAVFKCIASYDDGKTKREVSPVWTVSDETLAGMKSGKLTNDNATYAERTVVLTATYTEGGVEKTASRSITLEGRKRVLAGIAIDGDGTIGNGKSAAYTCTARYVEGEPATVTPLWKVSPDGLASVDAAGVVSNLNTEFTNRTVTLSASYTENEIRKTAAMEITLEGRPVVLTGISIVGSGAIGYGETASYACEATYSNGDVKDVSAVWSLSDTGYAKLAGETVTNGNDTFENQTVTLTARYSEGGVEVQKDKAITLAGKTIVPVVLAVTGDDAIAEGGVATYTCTATYNNDTTAEVKPLWTVSDLSMAGVNKYGMVTNYNQAYREKSVTLTAQYTLNGATVSASKDITLAPVSEIPLAAALNTPSWSWTSGGSFLWSGEAVESADGEAAAVSGAVGHDESSVLETVVEGSGMLAFHWKVSSEKKKDILRLFVDGKGTNLSISGEVDWTPAFYNIGKAGRHVIKFVYSKNKSGSVGYDCGWVDKVEWLPLLKGIAIDAPASVATGDSAQLRCIATFKDGTSREVEPVWSISAKEKNASLASSGRLTNTNAYYVEKTVSVTAQYGGKKVTKKVKMAGLPNPVKQLAIAGNKTIANKKTGSFSCKALYADGKWRGVKPVWSCESQLASVDAVKGKVSNLNMTYDDETATLTALFDGVTGTYEITLVGQKPIATAISISGSDSIDYGMGETYVCRALCTDGKTRTLAASWSLKTSIKGIGAMNGKTGVLTNKNKKLYDGMAVLTAKIGKLTASKEITLKCNGSQTRGGGAAEESLRFDVAAVREDGDGMSVTCAAAVDGDDAVVAGEDLLLSAVREGDCFAWLLADDGQKLAYETRQMADGAIEWTLAVVVDDGNPVTLSWNLSDVPEGMSVTVTDGESEWPLDELPVLTLATPGIHRLVFRAE